MGKWAERKKGDRKNGLKENFGGVNKDKGGTPGYHEIEGKGSVMSKKNEWAEIYDSFQSLYPSLKKKAVGYCPYSYMSILVYFPDGLRMVYNQIEQRAKPVMAKI